MYQVLVDAHNDIEDVLNTLKVAGVGDNRGVVESLKEALNYLDDMIVDEYHSGEGDE